MVPINLCQWRSSAMGILPEIIPEWKTRFGWLHITLGWRHGNFQEEKLSCSIPSLQGGTWGWNQAFGELMGCRSVPFPVEEVDKGSCCSLWSHPWRAATSHAERASHPGPGVGPCWMSVFWEMLPCFPFLASGGLALFCRRSDSLAVFFTLARSKDYSAHVKRWTYWN